MKQRIEIFTELGRRLEDFGQTDSSAQAIAAACQKNKWFSERDILLAVDAIRSEYLDQEKLTHWVEEYPATQPQRVAIIMAGNIPLVGFFDLLAAIIAGHRVAVKPSSKDRVLTEYIISLLRDISPDIAIEEYSPSADYDMVIATGGDEAARHFRRLYSEKRTLIRGSRHSVALLSGNESEQELEALQRDIFTYNGLGCRNVSLVMLPRGAELYINPPTMGAMYRGNYLHTRAMKSLMGQPFRDFGECIAIEQRAFPAEISCINYCYYDSIEQAAQWLSEQDQMLQCIVSTVIDHPRAVPFGRAQYPTLTDYADGVDVMEFLTK